MIGLLKDENLTNDLTLIQNRLNNIDSKILKYKTKNQQLNQEQPDTHWKKIKRNEKQISNLQEQKEQGLECFKELKVKQI